MQLRINREKLQDALSLAMPWTNKRVEILAYVKMIASDGKVSLVATDNETTIVVDLDSDMEVIKAGSALLSSRVYQIVSELSDESVVLSCEDKTIKVVGDRADFKLPTVDADAFPSPKLWEGRRYHEIQSGMFREFVARTAYATDPDSTRFALGGILFEMCDNEVISVATDGRRLSRQKGIANRVDGHETTGASCIVPPRALLAMSRVSSSSETVLMEYRGNDMFMKSGNVQICTRLIEGRFPNWRTVIPDVEKYRKIDIPVGVFDAAIRQAAITVNKEDRGLRFEFSKDNLRLTATAAEVGNSQIDLPIQSDIDGTINIRLDFSFVRDILKALDPALKVTVHVLSKDRQFVISTDDGFGSVVMPMADQ